MESLLLAIKTTKTPDLRGFLKFQLQSLKYDIVCLDFIRFCNFP